jgi:ABC-2 type transport system permease protein
VHSLYASALNETEKLWKRRRTKGFLLLTLLIPLLSALLLTFLRGTAGVVSGLGSSLPMLMLSWFTFGLTPLFLFMSAADSFSGELGAHTLKLALVRPITRTKVFASKVLAMAVYIAIQLGALWFVSVIAGWLVLGGDLTGALPDSLKAYTAAFVPMVAIGLIAAMIAQWFTNSSGAMTVMLLIAAAAKLLPLVFPQVSLWSVFSYTNWYMLWVGAGASAGRLFTTFALLLAYCIMAYTAGAMMFDRQQL